jgi:type II secretory pathway pseudopilin PulG
MKLFPNIQSRARRTNVSAFTLIEMMISVGIYLVIFIGVMIAIQIFALRIYTLAATKLTATADARKALNQIRDDIRQAKTLSVGNLGTAGSPTTFSPIANNSPAQGGALKILQTTNQVVPYTIYYLDTTSTPTNLVAYMVDSNNVATTVTLVGYITNSIVFDAEDWNNNIVTNNPKNNQIYKMTLQFSQWEYPIAFIGTNQALNEYNYYQLRTKVCRRAID